nr:MAG: hypothetical protein DIU81_00190 [[Clostridium] cellulosi]
MPCLQRKLRLAAGKTRGSSTNIEPLVRAKTALITNLKPAEDILRGHMKLICAKVNSCLASGAAG